MTLDSPCKAKFTKKSAKYSIYGVFAKPISIRNPLFTYVKKPHIFAWLKLIIVCLLFLVCDMLWGTLSSRFGFETIWFSSYMCSRQLCYNLWGHQSSGLKSCSGTAQTIFWQSKCPFFFLIWGQNVPFLSISGIWADHWPLGVFLHCLTAVSSCCVLSHLQRGQRGLKAACPQTKKCSSWKLLK